MVDLKGYKLRYITDKNGKKTEVILPIKEFETLLEDLEDLAVAAERRDEETISHNEVLKKLKNNSILP